MKRASGLRLSKKAPRANLIFLCRNKRAMVTRSQSPSVTVDRQSPFLLFLLPAKRQSLIKKVKWGEQGDLGRWLGLPLCVCTIHQSANGSNTCGLILPPSAFPLLSFIIGDCHLPSIYALGGVLLMFHISQDFKKCTI